MPGGVFWETCIDCSEKLRAVVGHVVAPLCHRCGIERYPEIGPAFTDTDFDIAKLLLSEPPSSGHQS